MSDKIAILIDPQELYPPSDKTALEYLKYMSNEMHLPVDFLTRNNLNELKHYSSLFIRTLTNKDSYTYQWAILAESLNIKIIDTAKGIALGSDKHKQFELCQNRKINIPETQIIYRFDDITCSEKKLFLDFPLVLKIPNGALSFGVDKIFTLDELKQKMQHLFQTKKYPCLILQQYIYTDYDWRIGILNRKPLFACKYYMVPEHWQIFKYQGTEIIAEGLSETLPIKKIPEAVLECVNSVIPILDNGFYGLDIKLFKNKAYLIEINDNPDFCFGVEDLIETDYIYKKILNSLCKT